MGSQVDDGRTLIQMYKTGSFGNTYPFSPNMDVEHYPKCKETNIGDTPILHWVPWLWEEG